MSASFHHHHDHVVVTFSDELSWSSATDLVDTVDTAVDAYFYREVEVVIASPGGDMDALEYVLCALQRWRDAGLHVRTRVISEVASAAALLFALADERVAEPGASFVLHSARIAGSGALTAQTGADIHLWLSRVNESFITRLADRALVDAYAPRAVPAKAERLDRPLLDRLVAELGLKTTTARPRSVAPLARALGRTISAAVRSGDAATLARVYRCVCAAECRMSAALARTLRLVDRIGPPPPLSGPRGPSSGLTIPSWRALFPPDGLVDRSVLTRHFLVLGETGAGKTASAILPLAAAMAAAPAERLGAGLVIDPKCEIGPLLECIVPERVDRLTVSTLALDLMVGSRWSLERDLAAGRWLSAARRILLRVVSFVPSSPARVLTDHAAGTGNQEFFDREGTELLLTVLSLVLMVIHPAAPPPSEWLAADKAACEWVESLLERARGDASRRGPNALALAAWVVDTALAPSAKSAIRFPLEAFSDHPPSPPSRPLRFPMLLDGHANPLESPTIETVPEPKPEPVRAYSCSNWLFARVAHGARTVWGAEPGEGRDVLDRALGYWADMVDITSQFAGVRSSARVACSEVADPAISRTLYFGCEPGYAAARASGAARCDFATAVSREGTGRLTLFQPARDGLDALVAMALKALFFEAVLSDPDRVCGSSDVPLVAYVADEFHRFVTSDLVHGEPSYLDCCRSHGGFAVLACQSVSSLEHALSHGAGSDTRNSSAISILWNNTGSKLVFRTTDPLTAQRVDDLAPYRPGLAGVTRVRPVSTLKPGECYAILADGRFERRQLDALGVLDVARPRPAPIRPARLPPLRKPTTR